MVKMQIKIGTLFESYSLGDADSVQIFDTLNGWYGDVMHGDTNNFRAKILKMVNSELEKTTLARQII